LTRRELLILATQSAIFAQKTANSGAEQRITQIIGDFEQQGYHRTATPVDHLSGDWLADQVRRCGLKPDREMFTIDRVDLVSAVLSVEGRRIDGIPLFDGGFTDAAGISGRLGALGSDAPIGLTEIAPNAAGAGALMEARRQNRHRAIVVITRGGRPGLCPSNAESFLHPFGPPVLQLSSEESGFLDVLAKRSAEVSLFARVSRTRAEAFNVSSTIKGANPALPPLVIMTPRSGWWSCAGERGGGIACWLELMRAIHREKPARDIIFIASSGHELGQLGIEIHCERRPELIKGCLAWIHFGANVGAAQDPGNTIQASDDEMEKTMAESLTAAALSIDRRVPRGTAPGGEAGVIHRGGGRYMSIIGRNALFHNRADRGPQAIDAAVIARFASAFTAIARTLAGA